jgi:hypothetical protein
MVFGWPVNEGSVFDPGWFHGQLLPEFGMSAIGTGTAGGLDPNTGQETPPLPIFGGASISLGFNILWQCLSCNPPQIMIQPQDQSVTEGMSVQFTVSAGLTPQLRCQWYCNNVVISSATNFVLQFTNVILSQNGNQYFAIVSNPWGMAMSSTVTLNVVPIIRMVPGLSIAGQPGMTLDIARSEALGRQASWNTWQSVPLTKPQQWLFDISGPGSQEFYRFVAIPDSGPTPMLDLQLVPAITLTGLLGSQMQIDYLTQSEATNLWVELATVTLTNALQFYFDTTAIRQPPRVYRVLPK